MAGKVLIAYLLRPAARVAFPVGERHFTRDHVLADDTPNQRSDIDLREWLTPNIHT